MQGIPKKKETVQAVSVCGGNDTFLATKSVEQKKKDDRFLCHPLSLIMFY
jgi:hypothetical protein